MKRQVKPQPNRGGKKVGTCRHYRAWHFFYEGPSQEKSPSWCPECGALRHATFNEKTKGFDMKWTRITELPPRKRAGR